ncbi:MAG TPA: hypothetical protein DCQ96_06440 [Verrucomicrobiales bacterium]|nr:hypothetical protein [Verrucomicrobiales bacterium]
MRFWTRLLQPRSAHVLGALVVVLAGGDLVGQSLSKGDSLWSLQPLRNGDAPSLGHPVDAFLGIGAGPSADRRALIRRLSYGLTGLPPAPRLVEEFVEDRRPDAEAMSKVCEALLSSPHYGEHIGRHWLDVVRYADTAGENSDHPLPHAWRYRNWVIDAFNQDVPYDRFVRHQLAGDLICRDLPPAQRNAGIIATGYLAISRRFGHDIDKRKYLMYEDTIDNFGKAFLGLSISCARCHDHKHDPISMRDYYALYGIFDSTTFSFPGCEPKQQSRDLIPLVAEQSQLEREAWEKRRDELQGRVTPKGRDRAARALRERAAGCSRILSVGKVPDRGSVVVTPNPLMQKVRVGEALQLAILPEGSHGADTTIVDLVISHGEGEVLQQWSLKDLLDDLLVSNPHSSKGAEWCFLDLGDPDPAFLSVRNGAVNGHKELKAWSASGGALPSVTVNWGEVPVKAWHTLPSRTFFCHPSARGAVAITWLSPVDGEVSISLTIEDGHPWQTGEEVGWRLEHFNDPGMASAYRALGESMVPGPEVEEELVAHMALEPKVEYAYAVMEGKTGNARIHKRGNHEDLGDEVPRNYLAVLGGGSLGDGHTSGRRALAERIVGRSSALAARVMVNRIWSWHFGRGLVTTPNDFGNHGAAPTHPELLDYLANYFIDHGWSVKALHRLILGSEAYRRTAGQADGSYEGFPRRRMTAEELRDTLLVASGELVRTQSKGHPFPPESKWNFSQHAPFAAEYETMHRSIYVMRKRNRSSRFFALFNGADPNASTAVRDVSTVPTQALYFMNDPFFHRCAEKFAERVLKAGPDPGSRLDFACRELFGRPVRDEELVAFREFAEILRPTVLGDQKVVEQEIWKAYARVLLGSNELLHID